MPLRRHLNLEDKSMSGCCCGSGTAHATFLGATVAAVFTQMPPPHPSSWLGTG